MWPMPSGKPGCVRSNAWHCDFSSQHNTSALSGGLRYSPMTSQNFSSKRLSLDSLKVRERCGLISLDAHRRCTLAVADRSCRRDLTPLVIKGGCEMHLLGGAIEADHFSEAVTEAVPVSLGEVVHLVLAGVKLPAATSYSSGFHRWVRAHSTSMTCALSFDEERRRPRRSPSRVASSSPAAPPPITTIRCRLSSSAGRAARVRNGNYRFELGLRVHYIRHPLYGLRFLILRLVE